MPLQTDLDHVRDVYQLCYVDPPWAWFTRVPLSRQWGDGWERAPYRGHAGVPYGDMPDQLLRLAFDGPFITPASDPHAPPASVSEINGGQRAWLRSDPYLHNAPVVIMAGTTLQHFVELIGMGGGTVYAPLGWGVLPEAHPEWRGAR